MVSSRRIATEMAAQQRDISVAEFFAKNRHLLGFDTPQRALLTAVKEAVDNSLDACEEARILPEIRVELSALESGRFRVAVQDNGPGIVPDQIARIFGKCCMAPSSIGSRNRAVSKAWAFRPRACTPS